MIGKHNGGYRKNKKKGKRNYNVENTQNNKKTNEKSPSNNTGTINNAAKSNFKPNTNKSSLENKKSETTVDNSDKNKQHPNNNSKKDDFSKQEKTHGTDNKKIIKEAEKIVKEANSKELKSSSENTKQTKNSETSKKQRKKTSHKKLAIIIVTILFLLVLCVLSFIFALLASNSNKIVSGVTINGVDVSNLDKTSAMEKLNLQLSRNLNGEVELTHNEYKKSFQVSSVEPEFNYENALDEAYNIGRSENNIFSNNFTIIKTYFSKQNILPAVDINSKLFEEQTNTINSELPDRAINASYKIEEDNLIISNSASGIRINNSEFEQKIKNAILNNESSIDIPTEVFEAETIDIDAIYKEIYKEPKNATFTTNPYTITKEEEGLDFSISLEEAKELIKQPQESYTIKLKVLKPSKTVKDLGQEAFPDMLATYSTTYSTGNVNRSTNIGLASNSINGLVIMPGETFSYNESVGQRTAARGYKEAGVYVNGEVTTGLGGGICQVSSTLYNATLLANLEILDRTNHYFKPGYVPAGQDATVSWGSPDFKFKNNRDYPIKLVGYGTGGTVNFSIYGLKKDDDYEVKIVSSEVGSIPYTTKYENDSSLPAGTQKVSQAGSNGCKTQTYKILYKNGAEVSRTLINTDTYSPHNQVIRVGTKQSSPSPSEGSSDQSSSVDVSY